MALLTRGAVSTCGTITLWSWLHYGEDVGIYKLCNLAEKAFCRQGNNSNINEIWNIELNPQQIQPMFRIIQIFFLESITSGRVLDGELLYTEILEVNLFAFAYRLFHEDFSSICRALVDWRDIFMKQSVGKCK